MIARNVPARRIVTSLLALLVAIMTLPGPVSWVCMLKSGEVQCCCISLEAGDEDGGATSCCRDDVAETEQRDGESDGSGAGDDDGEPCGCGDEEQGPRSVDPKDGGDASFAVSPPTAGADFEWPVPAARSVGAGHETQQRCTGPPLYVLFEVFLI